MVDQKKRIFLQTYGDSLTEGYPYSPLKSWPTFVGHYFGVPVVCSAENGRTMLEMVRDKERDLSGFHPAYVTLMGGTNDFYNNMELEFVFMHMVELAEWVEKHGSTPVICLPPPSLDLEIEVVLEKYREDLREWAMKKKKMLLDFDFLFRDESGNMLEKFFADSCHPNEEGYQKMGQQGIIFFQPLFEKWQEKN